jgi:hypothetical protein
VEKERERADPDPTKLIPKNKIKKNPRNMQSEERKSADPDPTKLIPKTQDQKTSGTCASEEKEGAQIPTPH